MSVDLSKKVMRVYFPFLSTQTIHGATPTGCGYLTKKNCTYPLPHGLLNFSFFVLTICSIKINSQTALYTIKCISNRLLTDKNSRGGESHETCAKDAAYIFCLKFVDWDGVVVASIPRYLKGPKQEIFVARFFS